MDKRKLVTNIQARATDSTPLISKTVKDHGKSVTLLVMSSLFMSAVRPTFATITKGFDMVIDGLQVLHPNLPVLHTDKAGQQQDIKFSFTIGSSTSTSQHTVTMHLHTTKSKIHLQGGDMGTGCTAAEWFSYVFVLPRIQSYMETHGIDMHQLSAINTAILDIPLEPNFVPTSTSSLLVPLASSQAGANRPATKPICHHCGSSVWRGKVHTCAACGLFIHKSKCLKPHRPLCTPLTPPFLKRKAINQDVSSMDSPAFHTPRTLSSALEHIDSDPETPTSSLESPLHHLPPQTAATILQPAQPGLAAFASALQGVQHLAPALSAPLPLPLPTPPPPP